MAGPEELEWIDIEDFSPGVYYDRWNKTYSTTAAEMAPDGAAHPSTFGCVGGPFGLKGMPKLVEVIGADARLLQESKIGWNGLIYVAVPQADPDLDYHRLIDFEVVNADDDFARLDDVQNGLSTANTLASTQQSTRLFCTVYQGWLYDDSGLPIYIGAAFNRDDAMCNYTMIGMFHYDASSTFRNLTTGCPQFHFYVDATNVGLQSAAIVDEKRKYGFAGVDFALSFDDTASENPLYPNWKLGMPVFVGYYGHWLNNPFQQYQTAYGNRPTQMGNGIFTCGRLFGSSNTDYDPQTMLTSVASDSYRMANTHHVLHAGRIVACVLPTYLEGTVKTIGASTGTQQTYYAEDPYYGGAGFFDDEGRVAFLNNMQLGYSNPGMLNRDWATGLGDNNDVLGLADNGLTQITSLTSINTSRLFITTADRGAILIEGDLDNPNVTALPGVESTYGLTPHPTPVNGGVVYGSREGMYLWDGGEVSQKLSQALYSDFWVPANMGYDEEWHNTAPRGRMAWRDPYLYVPNGWIHDLGNGGWWPFQPKKAMPLDVEPANEWDADNITTWRVSNRGEIYGMRHVHDAASRDPADSQYRVMDITLTTPGSLNWPIHRYDPEQESLEWRFTSQPLLISRTRSIRVRKMVLVVQVPDDISTGLLFVSVLKDNGDTSDSEIVSLTGTGEQGTRTLVLDFDVTGHDIQYQILTYQLDAPVRIRRVSIGWNPDNLLRQANDQA